MKNQAHTHILKRAGLAFATLAAVMVLISPAAFADNGRHNNRHNYNDGPYHYTERHYNNYHHYNWNSAYRDRHFYTPKLYKIGRPLPHYVAYRPVPRATLKHLRPAPRGAHYVMVGRDVLLISMNSRKVIGILTF